MEEKERTDLSRTVLVMNNGEDRNRVCLSRAITFENILT